MNTKGATGSTLSEYSIRVDKLLWFLRFCRNRVIAKKLAEKGHVRLNGRRVNRAHQPIRANDILTIPVGRDVRVVRIISLPERRGSAPDAQACYETLKTGY